MSWQVEWVDWGKTMAELEDTLSGKVGYALEVGTGKLAGKIILIGHTDRPILHGELWNTGCGCCSGTMIGKTDIIRRYVNVMPPTTVADEMKVETSK